MHARRSAFRKQTFLAGFAGRQGQGPRLFCLVRDLSPGGARLSLPDGQDLPDEIDIEINGRPQLLRARVVWRRDGELGITFVKPRDASSQRHSVAAR